MLTSRVLKEIACLPFLKLPVNRSWMGRNRLNLAKQVKKKNNRFMTILSCKNLAHLQTNCIIVNAFMGVFLMECLLFHIHCFVVTQFCSTYNLLPL